jgi:hypothetical protein
MNVAVLPSVRHISLFALRVGARRRAKRPSPNDFAHRPRPVKTAARFHFIG